MTCQNLITCFRTTAMAVVTVTAITSITPAAETITHPTATEVMQRVHDARAVWNNFPGFTAAITVVDNGQSSTGTIQVDDQFNYELTGVNEVEVPWLAAKLRSVISHRKAEPFKDKNYAWLEDTKQDKLITAGDGSGIYDISDDAITAVQRKSKTRWMEISVLDVVRTADNKVLPRTTSVCFRDPETGNLKSNRSNTFTWQNVDGFDLPARTYTVAVNEDGGRSVREVIFTNHRLTDSVGQTPVSRIQLHKPLKEPLTSFGAAVQGDYLYVFGGHNGAAHGFGADLLLNHFRRIRFDDPKAEWEELAMQPPAQSVALVSDGQYIYRIAGLSFLNSGADEETKFDSTTHFARYNPETNKWTQLPSLPEPRSSLDAAVVGRSIFVAGGWNLQGESSRDADWHETILRFDLDNSDGGWQTLDGPGYQTRAVSVAAHNGRFFLLGGIQPKGITRKVSIYDPASGEWSEGPELRPDASSAGFATSSFATGGHLYYTGSSGVVYRLNDDENGWDVADRLMFPRMFLRLLPAGTDRLIALGGTGSATGRTGVVESIRLTEKSSDDKTLRWSVPFTGRARHSQTLLLDGAKLYAFGGNASPNPHDFSKEAFVKEAFVFDISHQTVEQLPDLPVAMQSGAAVINTRNSEHETVVVAGGMGHIEGEFQSLTEVMEFDPTTNEWTQTAAEMPAPRAMHDAVAFEDAVWVFGGSTVGAGRTHVDTVLHWWGDDSDVSSLPGLSVPTPRRSFGAGILNGEYFMVGGLTADTGIAESVDVFDFDTRTWRQAAKPNVARVFPGVTATSDQLFLFGGFASSDGHFSPETSLEQFDSESSTWTTVAAEIPGVRPSMSLMSLSGRLLFYGISEDGTAAEFVLYDPAPTAEPAVVETMSFGGRRRDPAKEAKQNAKILMRKDSDKDGRLSLVELGDRMAEFFASADANTDGYVTLTEAVSAIETEQEEQSQE